jgi:hypothetical protein
MHTMYILCLKYVFIYTDPVTTTPLQKQWRIKSVEKDTNLKKYPTLLVVATDDITGLDDEDIVVKSKSRNKPFHPWFHIDEHLLMHPQCVGEPIPNNLMQEVKAMRLNQIHEQQDLPDGDPNKKPETFEFTLERTQHVFLTENPLQMPCYTLSCWNKV